MPILESGFAPPLAWRNRHIQTMWPAFFRKQPLPERTPFTVTLADGDEIVLEEAPPARQENETVQPLLFVLFHGLGGSTDSQYIVGIQNLLSQAGITSVAVNFRGAKAPNLTAKTYHGGSSDDIRDAINAVRQRYPRHTLHAAGFSIGANALLKYLSENESSPLDSALAVSVPMQLEIVVDQLDKGLSKVYRNHLLDSLREYQVRKHAYLQQNQSAQAEVLAGLPFDHRFSSFREYDNEIVAPLHGFESADDLYKKVSSRQFLHNIKTRTHILQAVDDPFMTSEVIPGEDEISENVTLEISRFGGHVGFYFGKNRFYTEQLVAKLAGQQP